MENLSSYSTPYLKRALKGWRKEGAKFMVEMIEEELATRK